MSKHNLSSDFISGQKSGYDRAMEFDKSNSITKALWDSKDRSHYSDDKNEGYKQGVKEYSKNHK